MAIPAQMHVLPIGDGAFGQALLDKAHALGADLLVMGAYHHSPLREMILWRRDALHAGSRRPAGADAALTKAADGSHAAASRMVGCSLGTRTAINRFCAVRLMSTFANGVPFQQGVCVVVNPA